MSYICTSNGCLLCLYRSDFHTICMSRLRFERLIYSPGTCLKSIINPGPGTFNSKYKYFNTLPAMRKQAISERKRGINTGVFVVLDFQAISSSGFTHHARAERFNKSKYINLIPTSRDIYIYYILPSPTPHHTQLFLKNFTTTQFFV